MKKLNFNFENILNKIKEEQSSLSKSDKLELIKKLSEIIDSLRLNRDPNFFDKIELLKKEMNKEINKSLFTNDFKKFIILELTMVNKTNFLILNHLSNIKETSFDLQNKLAKELNDILKLPLDNILTDNLMTKIISLNQNIFIGMKKIIKTIEPNLINILKDTKNEQFQSNNPLNFILNNIIKENNIINKFKKTILTLILLNQPKEINQIEPTLFKGANI